MARTWATSLTTAPQIRAAGGIALTLFAWISRGKRTRCGRPSGRDVSRRSAGETPRPSRILLPAQLKSRLFWVDTAARALCFSRVKGHLDTLCVPGRASTDLLIRRLWRVPARVAGDYLDDPGSATKSILDTPEASCSEGRNLLHATMIANRPLRACRFARLSCYIARPGGGAVGGIELTTGVFDTASPLAI